MTDSNNKAGSKTEIQDLPTSIAIVSLLKGPVYRHKQAELWQNIETHLAAIKDYLKVIGLALYLDESEGYAFIRQIEDEQEVSIPRLIQQRPLGFAQSVLVLLLRQWLLEHDAKGGELRAIIERRQLHDELALYLPQTKSKAKLTDTIDQQINKAINLKLIKPLKDDDQRFEILRIVKAIINADWLGNMEIKLEEYLEHAKRSQ